MKTKLQQLNPNATASEINIFYNAFVKYRKAEAAIKGSSLIARDKNGVIIENPLLKIQERCIKIMETFGRINNTDFLWESEDDQENP